MSTRAAHRPRGARLSVTIAITAALNVGLLWALARIAEQGEAPPPRLVTTLNTAPPPPPPPAPSAPPPPPAPMVEPTELTPPPPLPTLDLAPIGNALAQPPTPMTADASDLPPMVFPTVAAAPRAAPPSGPGDRMARLVFAPDLEDYYPAVARSRRVEGTTRVRLTLDARGRVAAVAVVQSDPVGVFEDAALAAARALRYAPALRAGAPVGATVEVELEWSLR